MPSDLSSAGNPLPSDRTPEALSPATAAVYRRYRELLADTARQAALAAWVEDCRELQAAGETNPWTGDCWLLVARSGPSNGMPDVEATYQTALDLQAKMAAEVPEARFNLTLGWKYYADHLDATGRRGEGLLALSEAAKQVAMIPAKLRDYPEITAILAAHHSRWELGC